MKYQLVRVLIFLMVGTAFAQKPNPAKKAKAPANPVKPAQYQYIVHSNASLQFNYYDSVNFDFTIAKGKNIVLEYYYSASQNENVADDEFSERFMVEIPSGNKPANLKVSGTFTKKMVYHRSCFCKDGGNYLVKEATVKAVPAGNKAWKTSIEFTAFQTPSKGLPPKHKVIQGVFKPGK